MKLWLLRAVNDEKDLWYDMAHGFVVRAETPDAARANAAARISMERIRPGQGGGADYGPGDEGAAFWLDPSRSTCIELTADGRETVIIKDYYDA